MSMSKFTQELSLNKAPLDHGLTAHVINLWAVAAWKNEKILTLNQLVTLAKKLGLTTCAAFAAALALIPDGRKVTVPLEEFLAAFDKLCEEYPSLKEFRDAFNGPVTRYDVHKKLESLRDAADLEHKKWIVANIPQLTSGATLVCEASSVLVKVLPEGIAVFPLPSRSTSGVVVPNGAVHWCSADGDSKVVAVVTTDGRIFIAFHAGFKMDEGARIFDPATRQEVVALLHEALTHLPNGVTKTNVVLGGDCNFDCNIALESIMNKLEDLKVSNTKITASGLAHMDANEVNMENPPARYYVGDVQFTITL